MTVSRAVDNTRARRRWAGRIRPSRVCLQWGQLVGVARGRGQVGDKGRARPAGLLPARGSDNSAAARTTSMPSPVPRPSLEPASDIAKFALSLPGLFSFLAFTLLQNFKKFTLKWQYYSEIVLPSNNTLLKLVFHETVLLHDLSNYSQEMVRPRIKLPEAVITWNVHAPQIVHQFK